MLRFLPVIVEIALLVYCLIDCIQSDEGRVRNLSKSWWIVLIVLLPIAGGIAWLVAGRPLTAPTTSSWSSYAPDDRPRRYDDDAAAARRREEERRSDELHEQMLRDWEAQLRAREQAAQGDPASERDRTSDRDDA